MDILLIFAWVLVTLGVGTSCGIVAKRYGVEIAIGAFAGMVVTANIVASKAVVFGPFVVPAAIIIYSTSFLLTDILAEKWGKRIARRAVWSGLLANVILAVTVPITVAWQGASFVDPAFLDGYATVLGNTPRIVIASMVAYLLSQHHDVWAFHSWRRLTRGKHLWLRNNVSTIVSQLIDSAVFISLAFYGVMPIFPLIIGQWVIKVLIAALDTPFCYLACKVIDRIPEVGE